MQKEPYKPGSSNPELLHGFQNLLQSTGGIGNISGGVCIGLGVFGGIRGDIAGFPPVRRELDSGGTFWLGEPEFGPSCSRVGVISSNGVIGTGELVPWTCSVGVGRGFKCWGDAVIEDIAISGGIGLTAQGAGQGKELRANC